MTKTVKELTGLNISELVEEWSKTRFVLAHIKSQAKDAAEYLKSVEIIMDGHGMEGGQLTLTEEFVEAVDNDPYMQESEGMLVEAK